MNKIKLNLINIVESMILEESSAFFQNLPPGFSADDFYGPEVCGVPQSSLDEDNRLPGTKFMPQTQVDKFIEKLGAGEKRNPKTDPILHGAVIKLIKDENGNILDPKELGKKFSVRPNKIMSTPNAKLDKTAGVIGSVNLAAYKGLVHDEYDDVIRGVVTCPNAALCAPTCYARKNSYVIYSGVSLHQARSLTYLFNDHEGWKSQVISEIESNKYNSDTPTVRWHDAGDFFSPKYLLVVLEIVRATPDVLHYVYSKEVQQLKSSKIPDNLIVTLSFGGKQDKYIDRKVDKHSDMIYSEHPKEINLSIEWEKYYNKKYINVGTKDESYVYVPKDDASIRKFKEEISDKYGYPVETILTTKELARTPFRSGAPYYVVIVNPKDSDLSATRRDVLATLLIKH